MIYRLERRGAAQGRVWCVPTVWTVSCNGTARTQWPIQGAYCLVPWHCSGGFTVTLAGSLIVWRPMSMGRYI